MARRALTEAATAISVAEVSGWELVDYATRLVSTHFETYSVLHPWESAETAFGHRRGYCTQYNGALAIILRELSLDAWLVYAARVHLGDRPDWVLGHTWVHVRLNGEVRDVCARSAHSRAGHVGFVPASPVRKLGVIARCLAALGSYGAAVTAVIQAGLHGQPRPDWVEYRRDST